MMSAPQACILSPPRPADTYVANRFDELARRQVALAADQPERLPAPSRKHRQIDRWPIPGLVAGIVAVSRTLAAALAAAVESGAERRMRDDPHSFTDANEQAARILARALADAQRVLARREEPDRLSASADLALLRLAEVADRLDGAARRMASQVERLADLIDRLERPTPAAAPEPRPPAASAGPPPSQEPAFPSGAVVAVVVSGVPGFQGLMDVQRALTSLHGVQAASVRRYQGGDATIELTLSQPLTAGEIAAGVRDVAGHRVVVDEAQPESLQLRLRCLAADA